MALQVLRRQANWRKRFCLSKKDHTGETKEQRKIRKRLEKLKKDVVVSPPINLEKYQVDKSTKKVAFVLGNGTSRVDINPTMLKRFGKIYGCNALYRSFAPDYLIAVDIKMIKEITSNNYHLSHIVWTNPNRVTREITNLNLFNPNLGWSSGPSALNLASSHGYDTIYILGFDYVGLGKKNELVNNVYAGTQNYKQINERATYFGNWQRQTATCIKRHPKIKYIRVVETQSSFVPDSLIGIENLTHFTKENFINRFNLF